MYPAIPNLRDYLSSLRRHDVTPLGTLERSVRYFSMAILVRLSR